MDKILKDKIDKAKIISFDMFDTLVIRVIDNPEILFDMMGEKYHIKDFRNIRTSMQAKCGLELQSKKNYPHANIDEIYEYIKRNTTIENTSELMRYEIAKEYELIFQNKRMYDIYEYAIKSKKRIIVTSDMYLMMESITNILQKCGYDKIDRIYLSSFERKAKFDGTLYDYIIEQEKVDPSNILHIGDSLKDDIKMAEIKGISTYHYAETQISKSEDISLSICNGINRVINLSENDFWIRTGSLAGLMYLGMYKQLSKMNYNKILFLSRDGYNLYQLFNRFNKTMNIAYCYTSRRALLLASITKIDDVAKRLLPPFTIGQTIREVLEYVGMEKIFNEDDLKKVGFNSFDDRFKNKDDINRFKDIYSIKEDEVLSICEQEREYALKYFDSLNILDNDNLFFDCGWNGSSQFLLERLIHNSYPSTDIDFYYFGILENAKSEAQLKNSNHFAYLFDIGINQDLAKSLVDCIVMLELFFGAPENSLLKYDKTGCVFDDYESELEYKKKIYLGIEKFFEYALPLYDDCEYDINPLDSIKPILRLIKNPTQEEAYIIGNIENVDAFAKQKGVHKYIANLNIDDLKKNKNIEIYWKYGLLKRCDIDNKVKAFVRKKYNIKNIDKHYLKCNISGINNPSVVIHGYCSDDKFIEVIVDGLKIDIQKQYDNSKNYLIAKGVLPPDSSKVVVNVYDDNGIEKTYVKMNRKVFRCMSKFFDVCYAIKMLFMKFLRLLLLPFVLIKKIIIKICRLIKKAWVNYHFLVPPKVIINYLIRIITRKRFANNTSILNPFDKNDYNLWLKSNSESVEIKELDYNPLISFVIPVYNVKKELLEECLNSILYQSYKNIEICLADDCSTNPETIDTLKEYEKEYSNIKVVYRKKNGHISEASNSALELVSGEYVAMMDNDDVIPKYAIYEMVKVLNHDHEIDMIYTDEDKIDTSGNRCDPHFKSDYAPDTLLSVNYFCHFTMLRTSILRDIGGWKKGYEGAQDWDLFLRFVEKAKKIYHLPKVLYHWRMLEGSTSIGLNQKKYAMDTAVKSIEDALDRRRTKGIVHLHDKVPYYWIEYLYDKEPLISIIIPTKDYSSTLDKCLKSIYKKTTYNNFEIIVVDNRSVEKETFDLFDKYKRRYDNFKVVNADMEFNYSKINNLAVSEAKGEYLLLLNNDTEVITNNWLQLMVGYAMQKHIGAVGVKLIYPDRTIQHGGVVLGMGGVAGHVFVNSPMNYEGIYGRLCVPYNYSVVTAACLMIKKDKFSEVNGMTEELKVAYNDVDFCLKLLDKGYYNIMVPMVELFHYESKSRGAEDTEEKLLRFKSESDYMYKHWDKIISDDPMYNKNLSKVGAFMLDKKRR